MKINNPFEKEIKKLVLNHLLKKGVLKNNSTVISELSIDSFSRRADLVIINDNRMVAFEIKSDADSLYRLEGQLEKYREYFDKVVVVATPKHIENILKIANENIEVWEVNKNDIIIKKRGKLLNIKNKSKYMDLLKVSDMKKMASYFNFNIVGSVKSEVKKEIINNLSKISIEKIRSYTTFSIARRFYLTSSLFLENVFITDKVEMADIDFLSPYSLGVNRGVNNEKINMLEQLAKNKTEDLFLELLSKKNEYPIFGVVPDYIKNMVKS